MATNTVSLKHVGSVELNQLIGMCAGDGGDGIPYPLWRNEREFYWGDIESSLPPLLDRFNDELRTLREWVQTHETADIWVECRVRSFVPGIAGVRLAAHRSGETGFVAVQRPQADVVDVYRLSAFDLGAAIAGLSGVAQPGTRQAIRIPGFLDNFIGETAEPKLIDQGEEDDYLVTSIRERAVIHSTMSTITDFNDITHMATVQSRCQPAAIRGIDWSRGAAVWVRIKNDGDYIYAPDRRSAAPANTQRFRERIDNLIADDVTMLRQLRGLT